MAHRRSAVSTLHQHVEVRQGMQFTLASFRWSGTMCMTVCFAHVRPRVSIGGRQSDPPGLRQELCVRGLCHLHALPPMPNTDLRPCPFCANTQLAVSTLHYEPTQFVVVTCSKCGAIGPRAKVTDPSGHAEFLWNQRFGVVLNIGSSHRS